VAAVNYGQNYSKDKVASPGAAATLLEDSANAAAISKRSFEEVDVLIKLKVLNVEVGEPQTQGKKSSTYKF